MILLYILVKYNVRLDNIVGKGNVHYHIKYDKWCRSCKINIDLDAKGIQDTTIWWQTPNLLYYICGRRLGGVADM